MKFDAVYYEPAAMDYVLGAKLHERFRELPWFPVESHNRIPEMMERPNRDFPKLKRNLIVGVRKTHKYTENHKISDFLVPYTSSGCSAMCLYCYLVCNYNKCSYLRLFVNREQMLDKLVKAAEAMPSAVFEIGSNSDLILENTITDNLLWTIPRFAAREKGFLTFPTKFHMVEPLLALDHRGRVIFRLSVNPETLIRRVEFGTSSLDSRIWAANTMFDAGYPVGILVAPVILIDGWKQQYEGLFTQLADRLSERLKRQLKLEIILMTYSNIHRFINEEAFPNAVKLYDREQMTGRARGKFGYKPELRREAEEFLWNQAAQKLPDAHIVYIS